ncbi:phage integrase N-terminal SAM-like domain-containing protein [Thiobaca trueperi]|uniref:phage integrase N-terminal SAM-like domain-containing protein n=1 Tax=Thiobaca trueperi TaxID=127458 RepID=UPI001FB2D7AA|nr:phage integrase N-terminal SAM-like domain-containing protein [Thiobaca trueperi]
MKHYFLRTKQASVDWINRFILFHAKRHPAGMGAPEIEVILTHPAVDQKVSAAI